MVDRDCDSGFSGLYNNNVNVGDIGKVYVRKMFFWRKWFFFWYFLSERIE